MRLHAFWPTSTRHRWSKECFPPIGDTGWQEERESLQGHFHSENSDQIITSERIRLVNLWTNKEPLAAAVTQQAMYGSPVLRFRLPLGIILFCGHLLSSESRSTRDTSPWKSKFWKSSCSNMFCSHAKTKIYSNNIHLKGFQKVHATSSSWKRMECHLHNSGQKIKRSPLDFASMGPLNCPKRQPNSPHLGIAKQITQNYNSHFWFWKAKKSPPKQRIGTLLLTFA